MIHFLLKFEALCSRGQLIEWNEETRVFTMYRLTSSDASTIAVANVARVIRVVQHKLTVRRVIEIQVNYSFFLNYMALLLLPFVSLSHLPDFFNSLTLDTSKYVEVRNSVPLIRRNASFLWRSTIDAAVH